MMRLVLKLLVLSAICFHLEGWARTLLPPGSERTGDLKGEVIRVRILQYERNIPGASEKSKNLPGSGRQ